MWFPVYYIENKVVPDTPCSLIKHAAGHATGDEKVKECANDQGEILPLAQLPLAVVFGCYIR